MKTRYAPGSEDTSPEKIALCSGSRILREIGAGHLRLAVAWLAQAADLVCRQLQDS